MAIIDVSITDQSVVCYLSMFSTYNHPPTPPCIYVSTHFPKV